MMLLVDIQNKCKKVIEIYAINFEIPEYMALIHSVDPKAFIITTKSKNDTWKFMFKEVLSNFELIKKALLFDNFFILVYNLYDTFSRET